jgi:hypothetical protein
LLVVAFVGLATVSACQTNTSSTRVASSAPVIKATSIEQFIGSWTGTWARLDGSSNGDATVHIRSGDSSFANADFVLNNGSIIFAQAPDYKNGQLVVSNGKAMQMTMSLLKGGKMHIAYSRFGNDGEYLLSRRK